MACFDILLGFLMLTHLHYTTEGFDYPPPPMPSPEYEGPSLSSLLLKGATHLLSSLTKAKLNSTVSGNYNAGLGPLSTSGGGTLKTVAEGTLVDGISAVFDGQHAGDLSLGPLSLLGQGVGRVYSRLTGENGLEVKGGFGGSLKPGKK